MRTIVLVVLSLIITIVAGCVNQPTTTTPPQDEAASEHGSLTLVANGEDFVRQGFVSKDGWQIDFDHVYLTLVDVAAYQTSPPFDAATGESPDGLKVGFEETVTLDLAAGDETAEPLLITTLADVPAGQYNALGWRMVQADSGEAEGYTLRLDGLAQKEGQTIPFVLQVETEYSYNCGEYVGDARKGFLAADGEADLEATFHFDHVFGDAESPMDEALNQGALGFEPLAALAEDNQLDMDMAQLEAALSAEDFGKLEGTLATLGHVGEGHCYEASGGFTAHEN